jgi:hypothetical protein
MVRAPKKPMRQTTILAASMLAALLVAVVLMAAPVSAQDREAMVRVAHLSSDTTAVDVHVNDEPVDGLTGLTYETVSPYLPVSEGTQNIKVYASGNTATPLAEGDVDLQGGAAYTVGAVGLTADGSLKIQVYEDDRSLPARDNAKLRVVHAVPDVAEVDVSASDGTSLFTDLGFPNATNYAEVPAGTYTLEARPAGGESVAFEIPDGAFSARTVYTAFVVGQAASGEIEVLVAEYAGDSAAEQGTAVLPVVARPEAVPLRDTSSSVPQTGGPTLLLPMLAGVIALPALLAAWLHRGRRRTTTARTRGGGK